jgi:hypothetical protein
MSDRPTRSWYRVDDPKWVTGKDPKLIAKGSWKNPAVQTEGKGSSHPQAKGKGSGQQIASYSRSADKEGPYVKKGSVDRDWYARQRGGQQNQSSSSSARQEVSKFPEKGRIVEAHEKPEPKRAVQAEWARSPAGHTRLGPQTGKSEKRLAVEAEAEAALSVIEEQELSARRLYSSGIIADEEMIPINQRIMDRIGEVKQRLIDLDLEEKREAEASNPKEAEDSSDEEGEYEEPGDEQDRDQKSSDPEIPNWATSLKKRRKEETPLGGWAYPQEKLSWGKRKAVPPPEVLQSLCRKEEEAEQEDVPVWARKKAERPKEVTPIEQTVDTVTLPEYKVPGYRLATSVAERDLRASKVYFSKARTIYQELEKLGIISKSTRLLSERANS